MAKRADREAMAAALGGMVSRPAPPTPAPEPHAEAPDPTPEPPEPDRQSDDADAPDADTDDGGGAYRRTGIGYVKADGTEMVRTVVMMTAGERRRLKMLALEAGMSPSDYVRRAVGFTDG